MKQPLSTETFTSEQEVIQTMLSDTQKETLERFRKEGTEQFSRNDYQVLATIRKNCRHILQNYQDALAIYLELTEK